MNVRWRYRSTKYR